ncbi:hypothetical protein [Halomonas sp. LBP4]|uniref:hypothetical protein n=1 Tax=Halomonas sp. LBP4 TaxID=2044917 RepID=UPI000D76D19B|nr:hypothetical protein [Halomonas sp. LBP4]PXX99981.1 hypothetical protein CR157_04275 [Halomonas sp. LBP4]
MSDQKILSRRYWLGGKRAAEQDRFFREALDPLGWEQGDADHWDAGWFTGMPDPAQFKRVSPQRKLNHFPGNSALTVKSRLHDSLAAMRARVIETFGPTHEAVARLDFFPRVYSMPKDYHAFQQAALSAPDKRWILKPKNKVVASRLTLAKLGPAVIAYLAREAASAHRMTAPDAAHGHVSTLDTLGALLPSCFTADGKPLDTATVTALADWLSRCERRAVEVDDEADSAQVLAESLKEFLAPQHAPAGIAATS